MALRRPGFFFMITTPFTAPSPSMGM